MLINVVYLISVNRTANENIRRTYYSNDIYNEGCLVNWKKFCVE